MQGIVDFLTELALFGAASSFAAWLALMSRRRIGHVSDALAKIPRSHLTAFFFSPTNVAWGVAAQGWELHDVAAFACSPATNEFVVANSNATAYAKAYRDTNRNGAYDAAADILLSQAIPASATPTIRFAFGDVDGDGFSDALERDEGSDPYDADSYCFNLTLVENGIFSTTNQLTAEITLGLESICGPTQMTDRTWFVDVGHVVVTNGARLYACFWDDANSNCVRDADEAYVSQQLIPNGHDITITNTLSTWAFDRDQDGILDWWEVVHADAGLSQTNTADAWLDIDSDGLINLHEYWADCDPKVYDGTNTAIYAAAHGVDDRIADTSATTAKFYFSDYSSFLTQWLSCPTNVFLNINTNCWMRNIDLSFMSVASDIQSIPYRCPLSAISPLHVIAATHVMIETNKCVAFRSRTGEIVNRHIVATNVITGIAENDYCIGILNEPLPNTVSTLRFLPPEYRDYIGTGERLPQIRIGRDKSCSLHDILRLSPDETHNSMTILTSGLTAKRREYARSGWANDSGHPIFLLFGNSIAYLCPARGYYGDGRATGYLCAKYLGAIQDAMDDLSNATNKDFHALQTFSFTPYARLVNDVCQP